MTAVIGVLLSVVVRRTRSETLRRAVRAGLAALLLALCLLFLWQAARDGTLEWWEWAPFQLCDLAIFLAAYALLTLERRVYELVYYWGCAGTVIAMVTPDLSAGFPSWEFVFYFALHGGVVAAAILLTAGYGLRPGPGSVWRALLVLNVYAAFVGLVNHLTKSNFLYLCQKPRAGSLLDFMGPWPIYILAAEGVALAFFLALYAPFRWKRS